MVFAHRQRRFGAVAVNVKKSRARKLGGEIREVVDAIRNGSPSPLPLESIINVSRVTFAMLESAATAMPAQVEIGG